MDLENLTTTHSSLLLRASFGPQGNCRPTPLWVLWMSLLWFPTWACLILAWLRFWHLTQCGLGVEPGRDFLNHQVALPFILASDEKWGRALWTKLVGFLIQDAGVTLECRCSTCVHTADWTCTGARILGWFSVVSFSGLLHSAASSRCCPSPCGTNSLVREAHTIS